jgi:Do/DeqQ family serine protease
MAGTRCHRRLLFIAALLASVVLDVPPALAQAALRAPNGASIADVAERAVDSVVNISTTVVKRGRVYDPFFGPRDSVQRGQSLGSGVVVSADGTVLTNNHVVASAESIKVTLGDGRELAADVVGGDPGSDLAVLKLRGKPKGLKPIPLGDSRGLRLGEVVLAIGSPFGLSQTVTMGIVSAKGRADMGIVDYEDFIQTDAAINPGNSGGALINLSGELVGINTMILSRTGASNGIGFAIPSNMIKPIMASLLKDGKLVRAWLGVSLEPTAGALKIARVEPDSPAARAGLRVGDLILKIGGDAVRSPRRLNSVIATSGVGARVQIEVMRHGKPITLEAVLTDRPATAAGATRVARGPLAGATVATVDADARQQFGLARGAAGVVIADVARGSNAEAAGLEPGDIISEVNRKKTPSVAAFTRAYGSGAGRLTLRIHRGDLSGYIELE